MEKLKEFFLGNRNPDYTDRMPTQLLLTCRGLVGGYLWYITYGLKDGIMNPESSKMQIILILFSVLFLITGAILIYATIRNFMIGRYVGGKLDLGDRPSETENSVIVDSEAKEKTEEGSIAIEDNKEASEEESND